MPRLPQVLLGVEVVGGLEEGVHHRDLEDVASVAVEPPLEGVGELLVVHPPRVDGGADPVHAHVVE
eukprot:10043339-Alexandrium_andersonii.AAC.1